MTTKEALVTKFELADIEDVRIIIKAKGKNFSIIPNRDTSNDDEAKQIRIAILNVILEFHYVVSTSLEDLKQQNNDTKGGNM